MTLTTPTFPTPSALPSPAASFYSAAVIGAKAALSALREPGRREVTDPLGGARMSLTTPRRFRAASEGSGHPLPIRREAHP
jgi:hypothetical protein